MPRREEALAAMRDALQLQDPEWDIVPGTAEYKILEALAQQIENITYNSVLNDYHFDVDKKTGLELDLFMSLFGFARIKARRATGAVTFSRGTVAAQDYVIPLGTQVFVPATDFSPSLFFQTTISAVLTVGSTSVDVPAQAVVGGSTGNVASGTITGVSATVGGITAVINAQAFSGGRDAETDTDLKDRWRRTVFRNISGTEDNFLGIAFNESAYVSRANLVGPIERYSEQLQLSAPGDLTVATPWESALTNAPGAAGTSFTVTGGTGARFSPTTNGSFYLAIITGGEYKEVVEVTSRAADTLTVVRASSGFNAQIGNTVRQVFPSSVPDSKYTFAPGGEIVGINTGLTTQQVGRRELDYEFVAKMDDGSVVPTAEGINLPALFITTTGVTTFGLDTIVEMEHEYTPTSSRNNFSEAGCKTADKVDIFVDGEDPVTVIEQFPMPTYNDVRFGSDVTSAEFLRDDGVNGPTTDDLYTQLSKSPIVAIPTSISTTATNTQAAATYYKDEDYFLVSNFDDSDGLEGSPRASNGIEWRAPSTVDFTMEAPAPSATLVNDPGKLDGFYTYKVTYEIDGIESLPSDEFHPAAANVKATDGKNNLALPTWGGAGAVVWRKIYRSQTATTLLGAQAGPWYLLAVVKNNSSVAYVDNKPDSALLTLTPPKDPPEVDSLITVEYSYNRLIERLDAQMDQVRLVGMDVLTHQADDVALKFNLAVVLFSGMSTTDVEADVNTILTAWINRKSFRNNVQVADVIEEVGQASGVDNVRLAVAGEEKNEVQRVTVTNTATAADADRDTFKVTIGAYTSAAISWNEDIGTVREILEALPNIHEGNTYATVLAEDVDSGAETDIDVVDNASLHEDGNLANDPLQEYFIQVDNEIMEVTSVVDGGANLTLTLKRGQLGSTAATHDGTITPADVHVLGDVAVSKTSVSGTVKAFNIYFLPNGFSGVNDYGSRKIDLITAAAYNDAAKVTTAVARVVQGAGSGVQVIAANGLTVTETHYDDFYLDSDELPSLAGVNLIVRAQNTF